MMREIGEQPDALARTLAELLPMRSQIARLADGRQHVLFVARGSSDNAAIYGRYLCEVLAGRQAALAAPSLATHYRADVGLTDTIAVCVSQSGETTQLAAVAVLASSLVDGPPALDDAFARVPGEAARLLGSARAAEDAAAVLAASADTLVTGRGITYGTALEVALKLEETCLRPVRGLSYADLKHGPMAVVDVNVAAVLVAAPDGPTIDGMTQLATTVRERHAAVVGIGGDAAFAGNCDIVLPGPDLPEALAPLALVIPGQLMVEALARRLGLNPDHPRGLSKVTQTES